jgi:hypothetical protein
VRYVSFLHDSVNGISFETEAQGLLHRSKFFAALIFKGLDVFFAFFPDKVDEAFVFGGELLKNKFARVEEHLLLLIHLLLFINFFISNPLSTNHRLLLPHYYFHNFLALSYFHIINHALEN